MDSKDHVMMAAYNELKQAVKIKRTNEELVEYLTSHCAGYYDIPNSIISHSLK